MSQTQVKFCGFRQSEELKQAIAFPIDAVGFILVPGRRRTVDSETLPVLVQSVPSSILTVGVLQNPSFDEVTQWMEIAPLQVLQLHGQESPSFCRRLRTQFDVKIWKMFAGDRPDAVQEVASYADTIDLALLDQARGGTGTVFSWHRIPDFRAECHRLGLPLWIAGGIDSDNVTSLTTRFHPDGIDVSSGIETNGVKDRNRMKQLLERMNRI